jgi:copper chaperone CopZ
MKTERFVVHNMKCNGCVNMVKTGLSQMEGISEVYIDLTKAEVTVNYLSEKVKPQEIEKQLGNLGYPVNKGNS